MNKKGDITSEDVSNIQNYIMNEDLQGYLDDENTTIAYARIFYRMVPCVLLDGKDLDNDEDLHEGLAAKDEAYIITNLVNNQESWSNSAADEFETGYKKTKYPTKWTSTPKGRQNARYDTGEKRYISGWDKDGMTFHIKALKFFSGTTTSHVSETVTAPPKVREALRGILPPELVNVSDATKDLIDQFVEHIKAVVGTNSGLVKTIQEINSENAKLQRKKNPRQALHNLDRTIVRAVENALRDKVWRKSYFLKETWEVYSDEITSFCYLFIGWAKLGDYHPERFGGMKVLWSFFVVPLIDMCLRSWRNNTLKRLSTVWKSMCNHFDIIT